MAFDVRIGRFCGVYLYGILEYLFLGGHIENILSLKHSFDSGIHNLQKEKLTLKGQCLNWPFVG
ncbi:hypothetical protein [Kordiimonas laminariae]|uniref:hypothetical protein n=1 Tax=Kordiimonas laminariae TaxID=2917717 RepID=UPI001FF10925|nr:hypothetical protein [Kordiimonas laminariae]MCK0068223.1 hypothetical protein [Kordiimonas laminariae]